MTETKSISSEEKSGHAVVTMDIQDPMTAQKKRVIHKDFEEFTELGQKFIKRWNSLALRGSSKILCDEFNMSIPTLYRIQKKLGLKLISNKDHPGRKELMRRCNNLYSKHGSTIEVAKILQLSAEEVRHLLIEKGIKLGPAYQTNPLLQDSQNGMPARTFNKKIKELYDNEYLNSREIAGALNVDQATVAKRLRYMGINIRQNHKPVRGGYPCNWCGIIMEFVWVKGLRRQLYCNKSCKNKAKDYRRYMNAPTRINSLELELKKAWGNSFEERKYIILNPKPFLLPNKNPRVLKGSCHDHKTLAEN